MQSQFFKRLMSNENINIFPKKKADLQSKNTIADSKTPTAKKCFVPERVLIDFPAKDVQKNSENRNTKNLDNCKFGVVAFIIDTTAKK